MATLGIDLSALSPAELQRLLELTRAHGEPELAEQLKAELAARRTRPQLGVGAIIPSVWPDPHAPPPTPHQRSRRHPLPLVLLVASIAAASATFGWWLRQPVPAEDLAKPPPPVAALPVAQAPPAVTPALPPAPPPQAAQAQPAPEVKAAPKATARARPAKPRTANAAPVRSGLNCGKTRDRADRMVCASADLSLRHRQMRAAYDRAIAAGADRLLIDRGQAVWREQRARASSASTMAQLYTQRIRSLDAAAKQARQTGR